MVGTACIAVQCSPERDCRTSAGLKTSDGRTRALPWVTAASRPHTKPKQWKRGGGQHKMSAGENPNLSPTKKPLLIKLLTLAIYQLKFFGSVLTYLCDNMDTFLVPVVPLVNWKQHTSLGLAFPHSPSSVSLLLSPTSSLPLVLRKLRKDFGSPKLEVWSRRETSSYNLPLDFVDAAVSEARTRIRASLARYPIRGAIKIARGSRRLYESKKLT